MRNYFVIFLNSSVKYFFSKEAIARLQAIRQKFLPSHANLLCPAPQVCGNISFLSSEDSSLAGDDSVSCEDDGIRSCEGHISLTGDDPVSCESHISLTGDDPASCDGHISPEGDDLVSCEGNISPAGDDPVLSDNWVEAEDDGFIPEGWGIFHPYYHSKVRLRVPWTSEELNFVTRWRKAHHGSVVSQCLVAIKNSREAYSIFHPHHLSSPARLTHAWKFAARSSLSVVEFSSMH